MNNKPLLKKKCYVFWRLLPNLFSIMVVLFMIAISVKGLWFCVKMLNESQSFFIFAAIAFCIIFLCLWMGMLVIITFSLRYIFYSTKVKVSLNGDFLKFTFSGRNTVEISKDQIEYSWDAPAKLTILLEHQGKKFKFSFLKNLYKRPVLKEVETLMRTWGKFIEDRVLIRQIVKKNSLNNLSSNNNFITVLKKKCNKDSRTR